jgi:thymidine phosphorylase
MLRLAGAEATERDARRRLADALTSGAGARKMQDVIAAQGGDPRVVDEPDRLPAARTRVPVLSKSDGFVADIDAMRIGLAAVALGAGRRRAEDPVDLAVGIVLTRRPGERVRQGETIAVVHARDQESGDVAAARVVGAFRIGARAPKVPPLLVGRIRSKR